jgi:hypothetical protein
MPTFAFLEAPPPLTRMASLPLECSPTDIFQSHSFGVQFNARLLSMHGRSTSELLRTL